MEKTKARSAAMVATFMIVATLSCVSCMIPVILPGIFGYVVGMAKSQLKAFADLFFLGALALGQIIFSLIFSFLVWFMFDYVIVDVMLKIFVANMAVSFLVYLFTRFMEIKKERKMTEKINLN